MRGGHARQHNVDVQVFQVGKTCARLCFSGVFVLLLRPAVSQAHVVIKYRSFREAEAAGAENTARACAMSGTDRSGYGGELVSAELA